MLTAGYFDGAVGIGDLQTDKLILKLPSDDDNPIYAVQLSYDGKFAAVLTKDATLTIFDVPSSTVKQQFKHTGELYSMENIHIEFSRDSRSLFYLGHLWNLATGIDMMALYPDTGLVHASAFVHLSDDGRYLFGFQSGLTLFDGLKGTSIGFDLWNDSGAFSPQDGIIAYGYSTTGPVDPRGTAFSHVTILDVVTKQTLTDISSKDEMILGPAFSPDGTRLAVVGLDDSVRIYSISWDF